jgi:hypothetical protein
VESGAIALQRRQQEWWTDLEDLLSKAKQAVALGRNVGEISAALSAASRFIQHKGKAARLLDDSVNVFAVAGFKDEDEARKHAEELEAVRSMSSADIHAAFMEFERRYALEAPGVARDYGDLLRIAGGTDGTKEAS